MTQCDSTNSRAVEGLLTMHIHTCRATGFTFSPCRVARRMARMIAFRV